MKGNKQPVFAEFVKVERPYEMENGSSENIRSRELVPVHAIRVDNGDEIRFDPEVRSSEETKTSNKALRIPRNITLTACITPPL